MHKLGNMLFYVFLLYLHLTLAREEHHNNASPVVTCSANCSCNIFSALLVKDAGTRGDGIGTQLYVRFSMIAVNHAHGLWPHWPHWPLRAGSEDCYPSICGSLFSDALLALKHADALEALLTMKQSPGEQWNPHTCLPKCKGTGQCSLARMLEIGQDLVSYSRQHFSERLRFDMPPLARLGHAALAYAHTPKGRTACVHYRLFDRAGHEPSLQDVRNSTLADDFINAINAFNASNGNGYPQWSGDLQPSYNVLTLRAITTALQQRWPLHRRILVGCDGKNRSRPLATKKLHAFAGDVGFNATQCSGHSDFIDLDIFFMSQCDVLVASPSTFSMMALVLAKSSQIQFAPKNSKFAAMGLFTRYDQSAVTPLHKLLERVEAL